VVLTAAECSHEKFTKLKEMSFIPKTTSQQPSWTVSYFDPEVTFVQAITVSSAGQELVLLAV
jgi:hypothetical protein